MKRKRGLPHEQGGAGDCRSGCGEVARSFFQVEPFILVVAHRDIGVGAERGASAGIVVVGCGGVNTEHGRGVVGQNAVEIFGKVLCRCHPAQQSHHSSYNTHEKKRQDKTKKKLK